MCHHRINNFAHPYLVTNPQLAKTAAFLALAGLAYAELFRGPLMSYSEKSESVRHFFDNRLEQPVVCYQFSGRRRPIRTCALVS